MLQVGHRELWIELAVVIVATLWNLRGAVAVGHGSVVMWFVGLSPFFVLLGAAFWRGLHTGSASLAPPHGHPDLAAGILVALWNYMGWDNASTIAGEVEEPQRTYPKVMITAALITMATYLLPVTAVWFAGIAPEQFSTGAWVDAAQNLVGYPLALALTLVAALDSLGNFNSLTMSYTRLPYAMACDGLLPKVLTRRLTNGVPWVSLLFCAVGWSLALGLKFDRLITVDISLWGLSVLLEFVALVKLRITEPKLPRPFRVPGPTWVTVALGCGPAVFVVFALWAARTEQVGPLPAALFSLGIAACGVPLYALVRTQTKFERRNSNVEMISNRDEVRMSSCECRTKFRIVVTLRVLFFRDATVIATSWSLSSSRRVSSCEVRMLSFESRISVRE